jgi:hypothetical protein
MIASSLCSSRRGLRARCSALGGAALLMLTGCLQADFGVTLNDDESGQFVVRTVINREQFAEMEEMFGGMMGETTEAPEDPCDSLMEDLATEDLPPGAEVEPIDDGEWCGGLVTIPFANLDEFNELAADFNSSSEDEEAGFGTIALTETGAGYRFEVTGVALSDEAMGVGGEGEEGLEEFTAMFEQLLDDMRITYDVRLPGAPIDHNADAVEGNRFHWDLEWGDERTELFAETGAGEPDGSADTGDISEDATGGDAGDDGASGDAGAASDTDDDGSSLTWLWILLGVVAVAAVVAFVLVKRNKDKGPGTPPIGGPSDGSTAGGYLAPPPPPPGPTGDVPPHGQPSPGWQPPSDT